MNTAKAFKEFKNMLRKFAWANYRASNGAMTYDDYFGEAQIIFCSALESFDATKASFSHYLYKRLERDMYNKTKKVLQYERTQVNPVFKNDDDDPVYNAADVCGSDDPAFSTAEFMEYFKAMPRDARILALWYRAGELDPSEKSHVKKYQLLNAWSIHLRKAKKHGWTWERTQLAFADLQTYMGLFRDSRDPYTCCVY